MRLILMAICALGALGACQSTGGVGGQSSERGAAASAQSKAPTGIGVSGEIDPELKPENARSYTTVWEDETIRHRTIMFPHIVDGCKRIIQSQRLLAATGFLVELEGPDCNCDLIIDGKEDVFIAATGYKAERMTEICRAPGVDGATRKLEIMRESLKEDRDFSRMENVEGF